MIALFRKINRYVGNLELLRSNKRVRATLPAFVVSSWVMMLPSSNVCSKIAQS
jgi:hypothetical protein